jgi:hypothetical protein
VSVALVIGYWCRFSSLCSVWQVLTYVYKGAPSVLSFTYCLRFSSMLQHGLRETSAFSLHCTGQHVAPRTHNGLLARLSCDVAWACLRRRNQPQWRMCVACFVCVRADQTIEPERLRLMALATSSQCRCVGLHLCWCWFRAHSPIGLLCCTAAPLLRPRPRACLS